MAWSARSLTLAASISWSHLIDDPQHAVALGRRMSFPPRVTGVADRIARWISPEPAAAADAWRQGRLTDAVAILADEPGFRSHRLGRRRQAQRQAILSPALPAPSTNDRGPAANQPVHGRVLHLVTNSLPEKPAGYSLRTHAIVRAQAAIGLDPHVVTKIGFPVAQGFRNARPAIRLDDVPYHRLLPAVLPHGREAQIARNVELASRLVRRIRPAVLHAATDYENGRVALALRERFGLPVVYEVRGFLEDTWLTQEPGRTTDAELYRARRAAETYCMREADVVLTLGTAMRAEIASRGVPADNILVVPNAVDADFLDPLPSVTSLRNRMGLAPFDFVVGTVSTLSSYEGIETLLEAAVILRGRGVPIRVAIVGDGTERKPLESHVRRLGLTEGRVIFTGRVPHDHVRKYYALLDVFALPRTNARMCRLVTPLKPVEAMASGLPVLASDLPAMAELTDSGRVGDLVATPDPAEWADALHALYEDPARRRDLGLAARELVAQTRTWDKVAQLTHQVYRDLGAA